MMDFEALPIHSLYIARHVNQSDGAVTYSGAMQLIGKQKVMFAGDTGITMSFIIARLATLADAAPVERRATDR